MCFLFGAKLPAAVVQKWLTKALVRDGVRTRVTIGVRWMHPGAIWRTIQTCMRFHTHTHTHTHTTKPHTHTHTHTRERERAPSNLQRQYGP